jgi:HEAT repeat protein
MKWIFFLASTGLLGGEIEGVRRVQAHLLIDNKAAAIAEAETLFEAEKGSKEAATAFLEALAASGDEERALGVWTELSLKAPEIVVDRHLSEQLGWGVLRHSLESTQYGVKLGALVGSYLTHDARAVPIFLKMMRDSNAVVRAVAVQMASGYGDAVLKEEIAELLENEKVFFVRLEVIKAVGSLRMKGLAPQLQAILSSEKNTFEERLLSVQALVHMFDKTTGEEIEALAKNQRAGMRHLACHLAEHFRCKEALAVMVQLFRDPHPDVRIAALNAVAFSLMDKAKKEDLKLEGVLDDLEPRVAVTAAFLALLVDAEKGEKALEKHLQSTIPETRRLAASALAHGGGRGLRLAIETMEKTDDPYVKANLAIGLLGQRLQVKRCSDILFDFFEKEKRMWMFDTRGNPALPVLSQSQIRYVDQIPNYPEAVDTMTRLELISLLSVVGDDRALEALKGFLGRKSWRVTGVAAVTLLSEGDESALELVKNLVHDPDPNVSLQACLVLAMWGKDETVFAELEKAYPKSTHEKKLQILEAIGRIGGMDHVPFLVSVLSEPFPLLRVAAASALIQAVNL